MIAKSYKPYYQPIVLDPITDDENSEAIRQYNLLIDDYIGMHFLKIKDWYIINEDCEIFELTHGLDCRTSYQNEYECYSLFRYDQMAQLNARIPNFIHVYTYSNELDKIILLKDEFTVYKDMQPKEEY